VKEMRVHIFQHVEYEGLGSIRSWLNDRKIAATSTRFFESHQLPDISRIDLLIAMGGPMSVNDEAVYPWLVEEKDFIRKMIEKDKRVLGICLGAQLIAAAAGTPIRKNSRREIGWFNLRGYSPPSNGSFLRLPEKFRAFHWHSETFELPAGAVLLAGNTVCRNQAFQLGKRIIGLQFHLEVTPHSLREMIRGGREELLMPGEFVQKEKDILSVPACCFTEVNRLMDNTLLFLFKSIS
jgi:GMP synthase-like glutamine amidotransferase